MTAAGDLLLLVVIYLRVSTEEQAKKGHSLPEQREACRKKAQELAQQAEQTTGQKVQLEIREFVDDFGGDVLERPALEEVREFVRSHKPAYFICLDPDRFSRSLKWQLIVADEIEGQGTRLVFVQQDYDPTDMMSRAFFQFRGLMSEIDKAKILERTMRGKRGKVRAGGRPNGACPYGYIHNKETDQLEIYEPEARWVRQMFEWVDREGIGVHLVTARLNELGVPRKRHGGKWYRSVVKELLRNTSYIGEMRCNRKDFSGLGSIRRLPREKRRSLSPRLRPPEEWITVSVPAIVDRDLFYRVQDRLRTTTRRGGRRDTGLLSLLARCGACGGPMSYARYKRKGKIERIYLRCQYKYAHLYDYRYKQRCDSPHVRVEPIEAGVWQQLTDFLTDPGLLEEYLTSGRNAGETQRQLERLTRERDLLQEQLAEKHREQGLIIRQQVRGLISEAVAEQLLAEAKQQAEQTERALADVTKRLSLLQEQATASAEAIAQFREVAHQIAAEAERVRQRLAALDEAQRRELVLKLVESVIVYPDGSYRLIPRRLPQE